MVIFTSDAFRGGMSSLRLETLPFLLLYALMAFVFFVQAVYLHKYARRINVFVAQGHQVQLEAALEAQRKFWRFAGALLLLAFLLLALASGLAFVASSAAHISLGQPDRSACLFQRPNAVKVE